MNKTGSVGEAAMNVYDIFERGEMNLKCVCLSNNGDAICIQTIGSNRAMESLLTTAYGIHQVPTRVSYGDEERTKISTGGYN